MADMAFPKTLSTNQQFRRTSIQTSEVDHPKFPQYQNRTARQESFKSWPEYIPLTPAQLVVAGLVYTGVGDSVRCFYCGGGLKNWERGDSPWEEHAKWYPSCPFVKLVKGNDFVDRVKGENHHNDIPVSEVCESAYDPIESVAAQACLQMGYSEELVKKAIIFFLKQSGGNLNFKAIDLAEILVAEMEDVDDQQNSANTTILTTINVSQNSSDIRIENENLRKDNHVFTDLHTITEENNMLRHQLRCQRCFNDSANVVTLPCCHLAVCWDCSMSISYCIVCISPINGSLRVCSKCNNPDKYPVISLRNHGSQGTTCKQCAY